MTDNKIFISYARADTEIALKIATRLREQGADIWFDKSDIPTGNIWDLEIEKALKSCNSLLFISSIASVSSENALNEVYFALEQKKKIVPVKIDDCTIPFRIQRLQYIDLSVNYEEGFNALLKALDLTKQLKLTNQLPAKALEKSNLFALAKKNIISSSKVTMWLSLTLAAVIVFLIWLVPCPASSQYFVFRVFIALLTACLMAAILSRLKLDFLNGITIAASMITFALIYFFDPASFAAEGKCGNETFALTVYVHGKDGLGDKILKRQGEVCVYLNSRPEKAEIDDDGKAMFSEISPTFLNKRVRINIEHPQPYRSIHPDSMYLLKRNGVVYLETELAGMGKIFGEVLDYNSGNFLDSVRVSVLNIETYTNKKGWFELNIPLVIQAKFQRVAFDKNKYIREVYDSVPIHIQRPFSVSLKKIR